MPELPDVTVYIERLRAFVAGKVLNKIRLKSPFLVRSYDPPISILEGKTVRDFRRMGKRIVFEFEEDGLFMVVHLMIAGRLRWRDRGAKLPGKMGLCAFDFEDGTLIFTEASQKKRASIYVVRGEENLDPFDRGGLELGTATFEDFARVLILENHTLKRTLTDPRFFSGIGNAYSDEILHRAKLSPLTWSTRLDAEEQRRLYDACRAVLEHWTDLLRKDVGDGFPDKVTAFRDSMAAHGKYKQPCPVCQSPIQRIRYAQNETNYCPTCQTGGKLLADRGLSRLLKKDWPRSLEELDELKMRVGSPK